MKSPLLGASYVSRSRNFADQMLINAYPEIIENKGGKEVGVFYDCPGLLLKLNLAGGEIRGQAVMGGNLYVVAGPNVYQVNTALFATLVGAVYNDGNPVWMIANTTQVAIFSAGIGYLYSSSGFVGIALPFIGTVSGAAYQDGFGVISQAGTQLLWQSNLNDLTTWNPLNFDTADGQADIIIGLGELHRQIFVFKQNHTEVWLNAGAPGFVFQRLEGVYMHQGCVAPYSIATLGEQILWLGQSAEGQGIVNLASGYTPEPMTTQGLVDEWATYPTLSDAVAFTYQQGQHRFYVLNFPSANKTWCLDLTASKMFGFPCWHERAYFSNGQFSRFLGQNHRFFGGFNLVGDYSSGNLYALDPNTLTDNDNVRKGLRSWRAHPGSSDKSMSYRQLELAIQSGLQVTGNPELILDYSDDGGHIWSNEKYAPVGKSGQTSQRVRFRRMGMERRGLAADRIFRVSWVKTTADQFPLALMGADLS